MKKTIVAAAVLMIGSSLATSVTAATATERSEHRSGSVVQEPKGGG
jgi:hypothetical protein